MKENQFELKMVLISDDAKMIAIFKEAEEKRAKWALGLRWDYAHMFVCDSIGLNHWLNIPLIYPRNIAVSNIIHIVVVYRKWNS